MKKITWVFRSLIPAILCVIALLAFRRQYNSYQSASAQEYDHLQSVRTRITELDEERTSLQAQLDQLNKDYAEKELPYFAITPIFTSPDKELFPKIAQMLDDNLWSGMMCLSEDMIPGTGDCISRDYFYELIGGGWNYCLYWDGEGSLDSFLSNMKYKLDRADVEFPNTIVFQNGSYSVDYDEDLEEYDLEILVHHGEEDLSVPTLEWEEGELIKYASCDWNNGNMEMILNTAKEEGGLFGITIYYNFVKSTDNLEDVTYFFEYIKEISDENEKCYIGPIVNALDIKNSEQSDALVSEEDVQKYEAEKARLEAEISKIDAERAELFRKGDNS